MAPHDCMGHSHDHEHAGDDLGLSLRPQIDLPSVRCLNEDRPNMGREVLKLHEDRLTEDPFLRSQEDDPELLLYIPFTEAVTVTHISINSSGDPSDDYPTAAPRTVKVFADREHMDFDDARDLTPLCQIDLVPPDHFVEGTIDYPLRPAGRFQNISSLVLFVEDNFSMDEELATILTYVGIKGKGSRQKRMAVDAIYETRGMKKDHKVPGADFGTQNEIG